MPGLGGVVGHDRRVRHAGADEVQDGGGDGQVGARRERARHVRDDGVVLGHLVRVVHVGRGDEVGREEALVARAAAEHDERQAREERRQEERRGRAPQALLVDAAAVGKRDGEAAHAAEDVADDGHDAGGVEFCV